MMSKETVGVEETSPTNLPLVVGIDLGGTQIRAAVLQGASLLSRINLLTGENPTPERVMPRIFSAVQQALADAHVGLEQIAGIGIGAPGPLDSRTGIVFSPPNLPGWDHVPLRDIFYQQFHLPIFVENDANAAALAEHLFGAGRGTQDMVYITVSTGIGGGVIIRGQIMDGTSGTAAELGHMTVDLHGPRCNCGNVGCLERLASGTAIAMNATEAIAQGRGDALLAFVLAHNGPYANIAANTPFDHQTFVNINARMVGQAAEAGVTLAQEIIANAAEALGVGLVNFIHIFNPEMIILGGGVMQMGDLLMNPVMRVIQERTMRVPLKAVKIERACLGADVGVIGAGALIYYHQQALVML